MIILWIIIALLLMVGLSEKDLIQHHSDLTFFPNWKWYVENRWKTKSWWLKNVFTMFLDGWHFWKGVELISISLLLCSAFHISFWWSVLLYAVIGGFHSSRNGSLFRKGLEV